MNSADGGVCPEAGNSFRYNEMGSSSIAFFNLPISLLSGVGWWWWCFESSQERSMGLGEQWKTGSGCILVFCLSGPNQNCYQQMPGPVAGSASHFQKWKNGKHAFEIIWVKIEGYWEWGNGMKGLSIASCHLLLGRGITLQKGHWLILTYLHEATVWPSPSNQLLLLSKSLVCLLKGAVVIKRDREQSDPWMSFFKSLRNIAHLHALNTFDHMIHNGNEVKTNKPLQAIFVCCGPA